MALHPLAQGFAGVAELYERGRPDYEPAVIDALAEDLGLAPGARVLDLAAGTGKLTRALVAAGYDVVAVEPLAELRELLSSRAAGAEVREGLAEQIPLAEDEVSAVTVADAFHWFDGPRALEEIRRVLAPGGGLAVLSSAPDWGGAGWAHELGALVSSTRPEHPHFDGPPWQETIRRRGGWSEPRERRVTVAVPGDGERVVEHLGSMSWVAGLPAPEREEFVARMRAIVAASPTPETLGMHFMIGTARPEQRRGLAGHGGRS